MKKLITIILFSFFLSPLFISANAQSPPLVKNEPPIQWQTFTPRTGGISVRVPGVPREAIKKVKLQEDYLYQYAYFFMTKGATYQISVIFLPDSEATPERSRKLFDKALVDVKADPQYKWISGGDAVLDGNLGIEYKLAEVGKSTTFWSRWYFAYGRLYELSVHYNDNEKLNAGLFFDSAKLFYADISPAMLHALVGITKPKDENYIAEIGVEKVEEQILASHVIKKVMPVSLPADVPTGKKAFAQIHVVISPEGKVLRARILKVQLNQEQPALYAPCIKAVHQWTFKPFEINNKPAIVQGVLAFEFVTSE